MQEQRAVQPQVLSKTTDLVPVTPGQRWRLHCREQVSRAAQFGDRCLIGWGQLQPLADRAMIKAELTPDRPSGRDVLVQHMHLSNAQRAPCQAPAVAF